MRVSLAVVAFSAVACLFSTTPAIASTSAQQLAGAAAAGDAQLALALDPGVSALYEMDEPVGATVMTDSTGGGVNGTIDPTGVETGAVFDGATGYNWVRRPPEQAPASPERIIQVPDNIKLEPGNEPFMIEIRYRTRENFGNITQKGQSASNGGQWKIQSPGGIPSCLFKGSLGQVATGAITPLNDNQWHTLTCVLTSSSVTMYVDGVFRNRKNGATGTINNTIPMTVGGKINCDQIEITCDYFSGQIDYIEITKGQTNVPPIASFTSACTDLECAFSSAGSTDPDGSVASRQWAFGDGGTSTQANPTHAYAEAGAYQVTLTVTDNGGKTSSVTRSVIAQDPPVASPIGHEGSAATAGNSANPAVTIPAAAAVGDRLVLVLSMNNPARTFTSPTGVTGWTKLDTVVADTMSTSVWTKVAQTGDPGTSVRVPMSGTAKFTLTAAAYSEVDSTPALAFAAEPDLTEHAVRSTPLVNAPPGSWLVSYWADKSSTTTAWTPEASVTSRRAVCAADGGRICSALADSAGAVPSGPNGNVTASTAVASDMATAWSIVLAPSDGVPTNEPPMADFSSSCTLLDCTFDSSDSDDPDGTIASYAWDFGDGGTSAQADPSHSFTAAGTFPVTLTVTDNQDATDSVTTNVVVEEEAVESPVAFVGSAATTGNIKSPTVTIPAATAPGDRLLLALSMNNLTRTVSDPTGWTKLDTVVANTMGTTFWTKVAGAADPGSAVTVPLSGAAKFTLTVAGYSGVDAGGGVTFARAADTAQHAVRSTPGVTAPAGAWVVSYWADKSSSTTSWTPAGSVTTRQGLCGADGGRICSALADSAAAVPSTYGNITATTGTASDMATTWSIVLAPAA